MEAGKIENELARHRELCEYFAKHPFEAASQLGSTDAEAVTKELFALPKLGQHVKASYEVYLTVAKEAKVDFHPNLNVN